MSNSEMMSSLFHNKDCPFGYQCLANDCLECSELQSKSEIDLGYDSEHQDRSYGTCMGYEIIDSIENSEEEDAVKVIRCKECHKRYDPKECPMCIQVYGERHDVTHDDGYCDRGEA